MHPCGNKRTRKRIDLTYKNLSSTKILIKRKKRESWIFRLGKEFKSPVPLVHALPNFHYPLQKKGFE
jgi:hypothetical protein